VICVLASRDYLLILHIYSSATHSNAMLPLAAIPYNSLASNGVIKGGTKHRS